MGAQGEEQNGGKKVLNLGTVPPDARVPGLYPGVTYVFRITPQGRHGSGPTKRVTYTVGRPPARPAWRGR